MSMPDILGWVKGWDVEYILIELCELVVFDYGLSDTQDGLRCLVNGIYILRLKPPPCDKTQVSIKGPWALLFFLKVSKLWQI